MSRPPLPPFTRESAIEKVRPDDHPGLSELGL
jgi:nuclear transport factor 2 (NTF2) superfamily protein